MAGIEKTVFISYRRTNISWAQLIFDHLNRHGYDVFFDFQGIGSGDFESIILENVRARAHFLVLLTPSALRRCSKADDWLRREIETAMEAKRNIVPVMLGGFKFSTPSIAQQLTGKLEPLSRYSALNVPADYITEAMAKLRDKFLNVALDAVSHPASSRAQNAAKIQQAAATAAPAARKEELKAEMYFERAASAVDTDEKVLLYAEAIRLKPDLKGAVADLEAGASTDRGRKPAVKKTEAPTSVEEPRNPKRAQKPDQNMLTRQKTETKQPRATGGKEQRRKKRLATHDETEGRFLEPRRRKHTQDTTQAQVVTRTKKSDAARRRERELRTAQNAAADRVLTRIRRERQQEAEMRRLEKEKPVQTWLKRLLNRSK